MVAPSSKSNNKRNKCLPNNWINIRKWKGRLNPMWRYMQPPGGLLSGKIPDVCVLVNYRIHCFVHSAVFLIASAPLPRSDEAITLLLKVAARLIFFFYRQNSFSVPKRFQTVSTVLSIHSVAQVISTPTTTKSHYLHFVSKLKIRILSTLFARPQNINIYDY